MTSTIVMTDNMSASEMSSLLSLQQQPMKQPRFFFFFDHSTQIPTPVIRAFAEILKSLQIHHPLVSAH
jgi:hypothetical protein